MNEAFVYKWINTSNGMIYVGYHKGNPEDGYVCSSKYFLVEYNENPELFEREILAFGSTKDMVDLETKILQDNNAGKNPMFYNKHSNNGQYVVKHTEETKAKISASHMGKVISDDLRKQMSERMLKHNPFKGKKHTIEAKSKMSISKKMMYAGEGNPNSVRVKYNGEVYATMKEMTNATGISAYRIHTLIKQGFVEKI